MPPKKHKQTDSDANQASSSSDKRSKPNESSEAAPESEDNAEKDHELFGWYCIARPRFDFENESNEAANGGLDEDEVEELYLAQRDQGVWGEPISKHPDHKWFAFWQTSKLFANWSDAADWCDPDSFGMYVYNDFHGYGLQEVIERMLVAFNDQFKKKERDEDTINHMWAVVAAAVQWLTTTDLGPWIGNDDGERTIATVGGIAVMFLSMLNELDRAGQLKPDSSIKDLPLVMAWYLEWSKDLAEYEIDNDEIDWRSHVVAYAKKAQIDLATSGLHGAGALVASLEEDGDIPPLAGQAKADRWGWTKTFRALKKGHPNYGGRHYDITQWSRAERAEHAFDNKDPLADIPEKDIKAGNIKFFA